MEKFIETLSIVMVFLVTSLFVVLLLSWPFQLLWNWLMPTIFGLTKITILQAAGLLLLSGFIFKSDTQDKNNK